MKPNPIDWVGRARSVSRGVLSACAADVDRDQTFPHQSVTAMTDAGLMGLMLPGQLMGTENCHRTLAAAAAELGAGCLSSALIWGMHTQQVAVLSRHGGQGQTALLDRVSRGQALIASVTTEATKGGDLLRADAPLWLSNAGWQLRREAPVVSYGGEADAFLVTMRRGEDRPPNDVVLVQVERGDLGELDVCGDWDAMGMRGTRSVPMRFDVTVAPDRLLPGSFRDIALRTMVPVGHLVWSAAWQGCARGCLRRFLLTLQSRPGARGARMQSDLFLNRLGELQLALDLAQGLIDNVAQRLDELAGQGAPLAIYEDIGLQLLINNLKIAGARLPLQVVEGLVEITGMSSGYLRRSPLALERAVRDLHAAALMYHDDRLLRINAMQMLMGTMATQPAPADGAK